MGTGGRRSTRRLAASTLLSHFLFIYLCMFFEGEETQFVAFPQKNKEMFPAFGIWERGGCDVDRKAKERVHEGEGEGGEGGGTSGRREREYEEVARRPESSWWPIRQVSRRPLAGGADDYAPSRAPCPYNWTALFNRITLFLLGDTRVRILPPIHFLFPWSW